MAGDWIKMRTDLYRDPKVCLIADELLDAGGALASFVSQNMQRDMSVTRNVTRNAAVGALVTVWGVMRLRGQRVGNDLVCRKATAIVVDDIADLPGFGAAMLSVGWLSETPDGIVFPNFFDEYNADPTDKKASSAAERQRRYRERIKSQNNDVTRDVTRDVTVTHREEKSRVYKKQSSCAPPPGEAPAQNDPIPYKAIIDAYNATMVGLSKARDITTKRRTLIRSAWNASPDRRSIEFWRDAYFPECQDDPFLNGTGPYTNGHENWRPDFEYLLRADVVTRTVERALDRMERANG